MGAKSFRWERIWSIPGTAGKPVRLKWWELADVDKEVQGLAAVVSSLTLTLNEQGSLWIFLS